MQKKRVWFSAKPVFDCSEIETLYHVLNAVGMSEDSDKIIEALAASLQADTQAEIVALFKLGGGQSTELELVKAIDTHGVSRYLSKVISGAIEMDWGFLPSMVANFLPRVFDLTSFKDHATAEFLVQKCDIKGALCVPIVLDGAIEGFYAFLCGEPPEVSEQDYSFLILLGGAIAAVLKYCDLLDRLNTLKQNAASAERREAIKHHAQALSNLLGEIADSSAMIANEGRSAIDGTPNLHQPFADLTQGELNVLTLVSDGLSNGEIANYLHISEGTVKKRIGNIMVKLDLKNRTQLGVYYARFAR